MTGINRNARQDLLDTAERLFAENGIDGVSLRAINTEAGYSVAALHYHFRNRETLIEELLIDRQIPIMARRKVLIQLLHDQSKPTAEGLAEALVLPFAELLQAHPRNGLRTVKLFFRAFVEQRDRNLVRSTTQESLRIFEPLLATVLPDLTPRARTTRWLLATELTFQGIADIESIAGATLEELSASDLEEHVQSLVHFIAGGLIYRPA